MSGAVHRHPRSRRRLSRPRGGGVRLEHRGAAPRHRDPGARLAAPLHPAAGARLHHAAAAAEIKHCYLRGSHRPPARPGVTAVRVTARGAERWVRGHPWIYRSDVEHAPAASPASCRSTTRAAASSGRRSSRRPRRSACACWSGPTAPVDAAWWRERLAGGAPRDARASMPPPAAWCTAKGDGLPSLVVDRYDRWLVVQILSAGLETMRAAILDALVDAVRSPRASCSGTTCRAAGASGSGRRGRAGRAARCHAQIEVREGAVRYLAAPWDGQKTGAFLDQRPNRLLAGVADATRRSRARLLRLPRLLRPPPGRPRGGGARARREPGRARRAAPANAALNGLEQHRVARGGRLRGRFATIARAHERFDTIVLDPPAFAKTRAAVPDALRGYREINLRAMRCLAPGGILLTASCSFHVRLPEFLGMLARGRGRQRPPPPRSPHPRRRARTIRRS